MTATPAGSSSFLPAKGLDISLAALQRQDPYINNIVDVASQVALYTYNNRTNEWEKTEVEGTLFIYTRLASPRHGFTIMNRLNMENLTEPITKDLDFQLQHPFLLYRNARLVIHGIWFYDKEDCRRIAQKMKILTQQEQALDQSQGGWLSPGGGNQAKAVDIIQMLTKARTEYDKSASEPKEIGGSSVLCGNPNLIKPIPVKPNTQEGEGAEPKSLSLATLFSSQYHHLSPGSDPDSPLAVPLRGSSMGTVNRPPVARTLIYEDAVNSSGAPSKGGTVEGLVCSATSTQQQNQPQHCPAIQKLMQGQRGGGGVVGVLQTVSESPENRLCDSGVPPEHRHHHHPHHHHQDQQLLSDPIKKLFQTQPPPPPSSTSVRTSAPLCCSFPSLHPNSDLSSHPIMMDSTLCSHLPAQQNQQPIFNRPKPQAQMQHSSQSASSLQTDETCRMSGVASPHELLVKLQLVQQEQNLTTHNPPRFCQGLAPRFLAPDRGAASVPDLTKTTAGQNAALQRLVTVAPNQLLSPSAFTQAKSDSGLTSVATETSSLSGPPLQEEIRVLSRRQLQSTLLNLIQTDDSFLDTIYEAYVRHFAPNANRN